MASTNYRPAISPDGSLSLYLQWIRRYPMLVLEEEVKLANRWRDARDLTAVDKLVTSHLRLVAKIAMGYRGYGLPLGDLISEGNVGMMQAVERFDPARGCRLSTYAMWWIRASIQQYILHSWSLVKIGTTAAQNTTFTEQQVGRGLVSYQTECSSCHQNDLSGSGSAIALRGQQFLAAWNPRSAGDLIGAIQQQASRLIRLRTGGQDRS